MAQARKPRSGSRAARAGIGEADRIIDAAMVLVARQGWRRVSLAAVASEAGLTILQVYRIFPSRAAILCGFTRRIDELALAAPLDAEEDDRPRDRLFDLLMRRFDALQPYRAALDALRRELPTDPIAALAAGGSLLCSMRLMLEGAGIACHGIGGAIAVKLTAVAYLGAARSWARDDSPDLAPTMAALDRELRRFERWLMPGRRRPRDAETAEA